MATVVLQGYLCEVSVVCFSKGGFGSEKSCVNIDIQRTFIPVRTSKVSLLVCNTHFSGVGELAHVEYVVIWFTDAIEIHAANT